MKMRCEYDTYSCMWDHHVAGAVVALLPDFIQPIFGLWIICECINHVGRVALNGICTALHSVRDCWCDFFFFFRKNRNQQSNVSRELDLIFLLILFSNKLELLLKLAELLYLLSRWLFFVFNGYRVFALGKRLDSRNSLVLLNFWTFNTSSSYFFYLLFLSRSMHKKEYFNNVNIFTICLVFQYFIMLLLNFANCISTCVALTSFAVARIIIIIRIFYIVDFLSGLAVYSHWFFCL